MDTSIKTLLFASNYGIICSFFDSKLHLSEIEKQNMNDRKTKHDVSSLGIIILINLSGTMYIGFTFM